MLSNDLEEENGGVVYNYRMVCEDTTLGQNKFRT